MKKSVQIQFVLLLLLLQSVLVADDSLIAKANKTTQEFQQKIEQIADWCRQHRYLAEADLARSALMPIYSDKITIPRYPLKQGILTPDKGVPKTLPREMILYLTDEMRERPEIRFSNEITDAQLVRSYIISLREQYAKDLSVLTKAACKQGRGTLATQLAMSALHANPDHPQLRAAFGFIKYKDEWHTPWEVQKLKDGFIDHPVFGWIPQKFVKQYEEGQRYYNDRWISVTEDAKFHSDQEHGWVIESEFYLLATNHSIEEGVRLRRKLEHFYRAWRMLFYRYFATDEQLATYFSGKITPQIPEYRHKIVVFRNKEEFMRETKRDETTGGVYLTNKKCCYFFFYGNSADDATVSTMFHEVTHQLFAEISGKLKWGGSEQNYWIIEGVAVFMETFRMSEHFYTVGNRNSGRVRSAQQLWKEEQKRMLMWEMIDMTSGKWTTKSYKDIGSLYTQVGGMFQYLMFADGGSYRDPMTVYLWMVYNNKDTSETFRQLFNISLDEFDRKYQAFLEE